MTTHTGATSLAAGIQGREMFKTGPLDTAQYNYVKVWWSAGRGKEGYYEFWTNRDKTRYFWAALGNEGEERSGFEATEAAKEWIRNGQSRKPAVQPVNPQPTDNKD
jgi:hypothetical protein